MTDHKVLWTLARGERVLACVMVSCCSGAELQLREDDDVVLRELYPDKASLYERARLLQDESTSAVPRE